MLKKIPQLVIIIIILLITLLMTHHVFADVNLALGKPAQQSSTDYGGDAKRAVDGNNNGNYWANSVSHTKNELAWWQVDLGSIHQIRNIRIWNRTDCCGERLSNFYLLVSETPFQSNNLQSILRQAGIWHYYHNGIAGRTTDIKVNHPGRYVRVQLTSPNWLQLAEVEVFGGGEVSRPPQYADLTGVWRCNDGGKYYIRQLGNEIWWFGENSSTEPTWSNVAYGNILGNTIRLKWSDVPKGRIMNSGMMVLEIISSSKMVAKEKTGGFGGSEWTREGAVGGNEVKPPFESPTGREYTSRPYGQTPHDSKVIFDNGNIYAVYNNPTRQTTFTIHQPHMITKIVNYHWNNARGVNPGNISLRDSYGRTYGPWQAQGSPGQGGVPNAYWTVYPNMVIPAGTYTVIDSDPYTWAQNSGSQGSGMSKIEGYATNRY